MKYSPIKNLIKNHLNENKKGYLWFFVAFFFALAVPVILQIAMTFTSKDNSSLCSLGFVIESELLVFLMVIIISLIMDEFVFKETNNSFETKFLFTFFPILLIIFCMMSYAITYSQKDDVSIVIFMASVEFLTFLGTLFYAVFVKQTAFNDINRDKL